MLRAAAGETPPSA